MKGATSPGAAVALPWLRGSGRLAYLDIFMVEKLKSSHWSRLLFEASLMRPRIEGCPLGIWAFSVVAG